MEEIGFVLAEENKFENWAKKSSSLWNFRTVKTLMQGAQMDNSPFEKNCTAKIFPTLILSKEIKSAVLKKYEFEYRKKN